MAVSDTQSTTAPAPADAGRALLELAAIFDNSAVGIAFTRNRIVERCNRRLAEILGLGVRELIGKPAVVLYPDAETYERISREAGPLLAAGESLRCEWQGRKADGSALWCRLFARAVDPAQPELGTLWIVEDVSEERRSEAMLRKTLHDTEAFMRNANVAILITRDRRVVRYNPRCAEVFGMEGDSGLGIPARMLYRSDEEYIALGQAAGPLLSQGKPFQQELWLRRQDGTDFWVNMFAYLINVDDPSEGTMWICEDRTAFKRAELELAQRTQELGRSNADLEQFAYVASHDLQEPLRMIGSYMQLIEQRYKDKLDDAARDFIHFAVDGARRMQAMINDLLAYSRVGTKGTAFERTDCEKLLATVLDNLRLRIEEAGARIAHDPLPTVIGDPTQLTRVFQNLISNALKFRGPEQPQVHVGVAALPGFWQFSVRDNGIGIAPEYFEKIFVLFQRLHGRGAYPGTGIGLAVCKKVVERHGGRIWVESSLGSGSTFFFTVARETQASP